ncbi:MAG: glycosyltransferase family 4 protein [Fusobacteriaceae bacterium]
MYDIIFFTNIKSFYKINLYNEIAKTKKILVIFVCEKSIHRNENFYKGEIKFETYFLSKNKFYEERNTLASTISLIKLLLKIKYKEIIIGGWDSLENWTAWFISKKNKKSVVVESSVYESKTTGFRGFLKKIFVSKISCAYASGELQIELLKALNYKNKIIKTKGVGISNCFLIEKKINNKKNTEIKNFIYVGRLSEEKNIEQLIRVFNKHKNLNLNIVGFGPLEKQLKKEVKEKNIFFHGAVNNEDLNKYYYENDVFILPSKKEPWGLVVEEALYNGLPVIISDKVGCAKEVINDNIHGIIYDVEKDEELEKAILKMCDIKYYEKIKFNVVNLDFDKIEKEQIQSYINKK